MVIIGSYVQVYNGTAEQTSGGLIKSDIKKIKKSDGSFRYVSKLKHQAGKKNLWIKACKKARKELGLEGMFLVEKGTELYDLAKEIHENMK